MNPIGICKCGICFEVEPMTVDEYMLKKKPMLCKKCKTEVIRQGTFTLKGGDNK